MGTIFYQWVKDSQREARRVDRALDREEALRARQAATMTPRDDVGHPADGPDTKESSHE